MWTDFLVNNSFLSILIVVVDVALCVAPYVASLTSQCTLYVHCIKLENTTTAITLRRSPSLRSSIPSPLQEDKASTLIRDERQRRTGTGIGTDPWRTPTEDRDWTLHSWFFWKSTITKTNIWYIIFVLFNQECNLWFQTIQTISNNFKCEQRLKWQGLSLLMLLLFVLLLYCSNNDTRRHDANDNGIRWHGNGNWN